MFGIDFLIAKNAQKRTSPAPSGSRTPSIGNIFRVSKLLGNQIFSRDKRVVDLQVFQSLLRARLRLVRRSCSRLCTGG